MSPSLPPNFAVAEDANHYPYHPGQTIEGVRLTVTDRAALDSPELGIEILSALHHLYPTQFRLDKVAGLVANTETMAALVRGEDPRTIAVAWAQRSSEEFKARRAEASRFTRDYPSPSPYQKLYDLEKQ